MVGSGTAQGRYGAMAINTNESDRHALEQKKCWWMFFNPQRLKDSMQGHSTKQWNPWSREPQSRSP